MRKNSIISFFRFEVDSGAGAEVGKLLEKLVEIAPACAYVTPQKGVKAEPFSSFDASRCCRRCFRFVLYVVVQGSNQRFQIQHV